MKTVFVGQQPNSYADEGSALPIHAGSTGQKLVTMMGVTPAAFEQNFIRVNVSAIHDPEGFTPSYHRHSARNMLPLLEGRRVVLLGPAVASAFDWDRNDYTYCRFYDHPDFHILWAVIPHPSGLNRLYNDPEVKRQVEELLNYVWETRDV